MIILILLLSLSIQQICVPTICSQSHIPEKCYEANPTNKTFFINIKDPFMQCHDNYYCVEGIGNCTQMGKNGDWCVSYRDCNSHYCVNHQCKDRQGTKGEPCDGDLPVYENQCQKGYVCDSKKCISSFQIGSSNCIQNGYDLCDPLEGMCFNGVCTKWFSKKNGEAVKYIANLCQSMAADEDGNCIGRTLLPKLEGNAPVKCKSFKDCKYSKPMPIDVCVCPKDNKMGESYCQYGGGESDMISAVNALQSYKSKSDRNHDAFYLRLLKLSDERQRLDLIDPALCSYSYYLSNAKFDNNSTATIIVVALVVLAVVPFLMMIISLIFCGI